MDGAIARAGSGATAAIRACAAAVALDPNEAAAEPLGHGARRAAAAERVEHEVIGARGGENDTRQQRLWFLR
jgi:hypothetical protein